jgi:hypothetical protein
METPEAWLRGSFCFLLYDAVNQLAGLSKLLHHFAEILLHIGYKLLSFHLTDAALCLGKINMAESDIFANVIGVSNTGLCQLLLEIVLHRDNSFHRGQTTLADNASAGLSIWDTA